MDGVVIDSEKLYSQSEEGLLAKYGVQFDDTQALFNVGFYLESPMDNLIEDQDRNWKWDYAEAEWQWYLSGDPKVSTLGDIYGKVPEIWKRMANGDGKVNSNYGYQWERKRQLNQMILKLKLDKDTRQAAISIYDGKEHHLYKTDTPCTYAVQFTIVRGNLDMCVTMRSNDLWYGFCNDQYQFSMLQQLVASRLDIPVGTYYHFAHNLHLYNDIIEKNNSNNDKKE